ncbi:MAG: C-GCAxxG-C-C family protein [Eubacteriales bacterium]
MDSTASEALAAFNNGLNCAQTVLSAYCEKYGMDKETAYKIAGGLGGGFRSGEICGAVSGAVLVIGLKYGQNIPEDKLAKAECYVKTEEFIDAFRQMNGSAICRELLGCDISTSGGRDIAMEKDLFNTVCADLVKNAILLLEDLGY